MVDLKHIEEGSGNNLTNAGKMCEVIRILHVGYKSYTKGDRKRATSKQTVWNCGHVFLIICERLRSDTPRTQLCPSIWFPWMRCGIYTARKFHCHFRFMRYDSSAKYENDTYNFLLGISYTWEHIRCHVTEDICFHREDTGHMPHSSPPAFCRHWLYHLYDSIFPGFLMWFCL